MLTKGIIQMLGLKEEDLQKSLSFFSTLQNDIEEIKANQRLIISLLQIPNADLNSITMTQDARSILPEPEETENGN